MRKAVLLYNPDSGGNRSRRLSEVQSALAILRGANVEAELVLTESVAHAGEHASRAIQNGCDTIFACGGDGTIHNIIQVLAQTKVALAILPMGTGNTLAHDLGLPLKVMAAARASLHAKPRRVALGRVQYLDLRGNPGSRFFVVAAGIGVDAHLFYKLKQGIKQRWGMTAYYLKAWHLWLTYPMSRFQAEFVENGSSEMRQASLTELMCVPQPGPFERRFILRVRYGSLPTECRKFFSTAAANGFHQVRIQMADEILKRRYFAVFLAHKKQWNKGRQQRHAGREFQCLEAYERTEAFSRGAISDLIVILIANYET